MNDDYIKRKEALSAIKQMSEEHYPYKTIFRAIRILHHVPTADVRENVRGEWLPHPIKGNREWDVCSACGVGCKRREYGIHANGDKWVTEYNFNFCPNCGADMRGES